MYPEAPVIAFQDKLTVVPEAPQEGAGFVVHGSGVGVGGAGQEVVVVSVLLEQLSGSATFITPQ